MGYSKPFVELATEGRIVFQVRDITKWTAAARTRLGIGRSFQLTNVFPTLSVLENVRLAVQARQGLGLAAWRDYRRFPELADRAYAGLTEVLPRVVDYPGCSERSHQLRAGRAADAGHGCTEVPCQLHCGRAHRPRRSIDQDPFAWLNLGLVPQVEQAGQTAEHDESCLACRTFVAGVKEPARHRQRVEREHNDVSVLQFVQQRPHVRAARIHLRL